MKNVLVVLFVLGLVTAIGFASCSAKDLNFDEAVTAYYKDVKGNPEKEKVVKEYFSKAMLESINRINESVPQRIDSVTWFNGATFIGNKARYKYGVETREFIEAGMNEQEIIDMIASAEFEKTYVYTPLCSNPRIKFLINEMGVTISYLYSDEISNRYLATIEVSRCE